MLIPHGSFLTASMVGLPRGWVSKATLGATRIGNPGQVVEDTTFTGVVAVVAPNVTFRRCRFYGRVTNGEDPRYPFLIQDSEIGASAPDLLEWNNGCVGGSDYILHRCYIHDISEGPRTQRNCRLIETFIHRIVGAGVKPHTDAVQLDGHGGYSGGRIEIVRCKIDGRWRDDKTFGSAAVQCGGRNPDTGDTMTDTVVAISDSYVAGGGYTLRLEDASAARSVRYEVTGSVAERYSYAYGALSTSGSDPKQILWEDNRYSDGTPWVLN